VVKTCELDEKNLPPYLLMACNGVDAYMNAYKSSAVSKLNKYQISLNGRLESTYYETGSEIFRTYCEKGQAKS
jgi:hypothetical protein